MKILFTTLILEEAIAFCDRRETRFNDHVIIERTIDGKYNVVRP
jgi:hypothetical protein